MSDLSLADTAYRHVVDMYAVFVDRDVQTESLQQSWWWRFLKPGFHHVELWKPYHGCWLRIDTGIEMVELSTFAQPPWIAAAHRNPTVLRVRRIVPRGKWRSVWQAGPSTCVELCKAFLGVRAFWVRTPWQLYKHLRKSQ